ncbi:PEP-CTERM sorting domain-containing protein [Catenovulum agarivorans]|uniref:PEP-CTERM sorting domain-containing protein n=1 Tax=Catenovulum agarivorans TaxID=1172192 RepID=UPI00030DD247|nr:PEP-CTERM sorting domain-containing protein [Catenovulum agarivorans]
MKFLAMIFSLALAFNASAGLITTQADQTNYNAGDFITLEFFVEDANPTIDWLQFEFAFDDSQFAFVDFSWIDSFEVASYGAFGDAYLVDTDILFMNVGFLDGFADVLGTSFKLGEVQFEALANAPSPTLSVVDSYVTDFDFTEIEPAQHQVSVPEPATYALLPLIAGLLFMRKRKQA